MRARGSNQDVDLETVRLREIRGGELHPAPLLIGFKIEATLQASRLSFAMINDPAGNRHGRRASASSEAALDRDLGGDGPARAV